MAINANIQSGTNVCNNCNGSGRVKIAKARQHPLICPYCCGSGKIKTHN